MGDRGEEVGPQSFKLGEVLDDPRVGTQAAAQHMAAEAREDVEAKIAVVARNPDKAEAGQLTEEDGDLDGFDRRTCLGEPLARSAGVAPSAMRASAAPASGDGDAPPG